MKWANLNATKCPECNKQLTRHFSGYECRSFDTYLNKPCEFFITFEKYDAIRKKMREARKSWK